MKYQFVIVENKFSKERPKTFESLKDAAKYLRISYSCAYKHMKNQTKYLGAYSFKNLKFKKSFCVSSEKGLKFYE